MITELHDRTSAKQYAEYYDKIFIYKDEDYGWSFCCPWHNDGEEWIAMHYSPFSSWRLAFTASTIHARLQHRQA